MLLRIGRLSSRHAIAEQGALFGLATVLASKVLPIPTQLKIGLESMQGGFRKIWQSFGQEMHLRVEDRDDKMAYVAETCTMCAGKQATAPICMCFTGVLQESIHWATSKEFAIAEVTCRAMGAPACVWEIPKKPQET
jgi:predicted hydrocarbon binding protein